MLHGKMSEMGTTPNSACYQDAGQEGTMAASHVDRDHLCANTRVEVVGLLPSTSSTKQFVQRPVAADPSVGCSWGVSDTKIHRGPESR